MVCLGATFCHVEVTGSGLRGLDQVIGRFGVAGLRGVT